MQIVIDISEDDYRKVQDGRASVSMMRKAIVNGTPLPKGHGRLIDDDELKKKKNLLGASNYYEYLVITMENIKNAPTIIEAENDEEAIGKFKADCPYDIDSSTIECEEDKESKE